MYIQVKEKGDNAAADSALLKRNSMKIKGIAGKI